MDLYSSMLRSYTNFLRTDFGICNPTIVAIEQTGDCSQWAVAFYYREYRFHLSQGVNLYLEWYHKNLMHLKFLILKII